MFGLSAGSAFMNYEAQVDAAENQGQALVDAENARQADLARQMQQQAEAATEEMNAANRQAIADMATLDAVAGEYGLGRSVSRERAVMGVQQGETMATIRANGRRNLAEIGYGARASQANTRAQLKAIPVPSKVGLALQIGSAAAQSYGGYKTNQRLDKLAAQNPGKPPPNP
ncbi:MAG: hypothetical protein ACK4K3_07430 [Aquabacterium sp.]